MQPNDVIKLIQQELDRRQTDNRYNNTYTNITHNGLDGPILPLVQTNKAFFILSTSTNATTAVNVFNAFGCPYNGTITGVFLVAKDATASNITFANGGSTVATIAKGATAGAMVGATSLANTTLKKGKQCTVVSDGTGNAYVFVVYTTSS